jgi:hypothetical protein
MIRDYYGGEYEDGRLRVVALMMEAVQTSETSVNSHRPTRHYNPQDSHLRPYSVDKPKYDICFI